MPYLTREDIASIVTSNTLPPEDGGPPNSERVAIVCETFDRPMIALDDDFPYDEVLQCADPKKVQAAIYLATLQHQYVSMIGTVGHMSRATAETHCTWLHLCVMKMEWHLDHLTKGQPTPPIPFVN